jgi:Mg-chelatase subunit ChlD
MRLGNEKYYQGDMFVAFKNYAAALELFKTTNNTKGQGICLNNLGNIYRDWGEYAKAREAFDGAIQIAKADKSFAGLSSRLNNRGLLALAASEWIQAEEDFKDAMRIDKEMQAEDRVATRKRNLGVLNFLRDKDSDARKLLEEALEIDTRLDLKAGLADDHFQLGRLDLKANNTSSAEQHFTTALAIAKSFMNNPLARNILGQLVSLYDQQDNTAALHKAEAELAKINELLIRKKDVVFVIDQSGSMQEQNKMRSARRGALEVFNMTINPGDRVAIIGFHSIVNEILPPTPKAGNIETIQKTFQSVDFTPYQTAFYDAVGKAIDDLKDSPQGFQHWIVALTDGQDNNSKRFNPQTLVNYIKELKFPLNLVLIGVGRELRNVFYEMNLIVTSAPRGKYIPIYAETNLAQQIEGAFKQVQEILASSEIEGFTPEEK